MLCDRKSDAGDGREYDYEFEQNNGTGYMRLRSYTMQFQELIHHPSECPQ